MYVPRSFLTLALILALLAAVVPAAAAARLSEPELVKGLLNLAQLETIGYRIEYLRAVHGNLDLGANTREAAAALRVAEDQLIDPWGKAYRIELTTAGYRIRGGKDCVYGNGRFVKSNETKLVNMLTAAEKNDYSMMASLRAARDGAKSDLAATPGRAYRLLMVARARRLLLTAPEYRIGLMADESFDTMRTIEAAIRAWRAGHDGSLLALSTSPDVVAALRAARSPVSGRLRFVDEWGTPIRVTVTESGYRITSAGSDRRFDRATGEGQTIDPAVDQVIADGTAVTRFSLDDFVRRAAASARH